MAPSGWRGWRLALASAAASAAAAKCKPFKCYGKKEMVPKSPYFAPKDGACPEGVSAALAPCCAAREACAGVCGATEDACQAAFETCAATACDGVDNTDEHDVCLKDAKLASESWREIWPCAKHAAAQKKACTCQSAVDAAARRRQVLQHVYKRYAGGIEGDKLDGLLIKADTPRAFASLLLKLSAKYPALLSDATPPKKKKAKPADDGEPRMTPHMKKILEDRKRRNEKVKRPADATPLEKPAPVEEEDDVWDLDDGDEEGEL